MVEEVRAQLLALAPGYAATSRPPAGVRGAALASAAKPDWLRARLLASGRRWRTPDHRVAGTLWWYSATLCLFAEPLAAWLLTGTALDPSPESMVLRERTDLTPVGGQATRVLAASAAGGTGVAEVGVALRRTIELCVSGLAAVGGGGERALWSIAADALAGTLLGTGSAVGAAERAVAAAAELAAAVGPPLPRPRFTRAPMARDVGELLAVGVDGLADRPRRPFVRRGSCCLIYLAGPPANPKCVSCPRQPPADRLLRLAAAAAG